jgi:predicted RNase H-like HicB family nuclease
MRHYIALIHKESGSGHGVSFPDLPGVVTVGDSIDEAIQKAAEVLEFAAEDWATHTGRDFPKARTIAESRVDPAFRNDASDAIVAAIPLRYQAEAAE